MKSQHRQAIITGTGRYLPERVLTNADLEKMVDTTDEWILTRTGIRERRIAHAEEYTSSMGVLAAKRAIEEAGIDVKEIDLVIVATVTGDYLFPSTSTLIQHALGAENAGAFDIQAACSGFIYGLGIAQSFIASGAYSTILLVAAEKLSTLVDYTDRNSCVLFGDGAGAAIIQGKGKGLAIGPVCLGADGAQAELLRVPAGGSRQPTTADTVACGQHFLSMNGKEVFKHAVRRMEAVAEECLKKANITAEEVNWLIPHQANQRIIDAIAERFGFPHERVFKTLEKYGNTSASSVAIALDELKEEHVLHAGNHLLMVAFGAGLTWAGALLTRVE